MREITEYSWKQSRDWEKGRKEKDTKEEKEREEWSNDRDEW